MTKLSRSTVLVALLALVVPYLLLPPACAQSRLSDKDVEQRMKNMDEDIKKFRSAFDSSVSKTSIRKTAQEKSAKKLVDDLQRESNSLLEKFKKTKKADPYLQNCLDLATQIETVMQSAQFDSNTAAQWAKIKTELSELAVAFNVPGY